MDEGDLPPVVESATEAPIIPGIPRGAYCGIYPDQFAEIICSRCGTFICAEGNFGGEKGSEVCVNCAKGGLESPVPWDRAKGLGYRTAYWETTKILLRDSVRFFKTPPTSSTGWGLAYGVVAYTVGQLLAALLVALLMLLSGGIMGGIGAQSDAMPPGMTGFFMAYFGCLGIAIVPMTLMQAPVGGLFGIAASVVGTHGTLKMFGWSKGGIETTMRAVSYANAPYVLYGIPCVGPIIGFFWVILLEVRGIREVHSLSNDKAIFAVVGYRIVLMLLVGGLYGAFVALSIAGIQADQGFSP